jgi:hypothetical protein
MSQPAIADHVADPTEARTIDPDDAENLMWDCDPVDPVGTRTKAVDTTNDHLVGMQGGKVVMVLPPACPMDRDEALRMAAWIQLLADPLGERFETIRSAIANT